MVFYYQGSKKELREGTVQYLPYPEETVQIRTLKGQVLGDTLTNHKGKFSIKVADSSISEKGILIVVYGKTIKNKRKDYKGHYRYTSKTLKWYDPDLPVEIHIRKKGKIRKKTGFLKREKKTPYIYGF